RAGRGAGPHTLGSRSPGRYPRIQAACGRASETVGVEEDVADGGAGEPDAGEFFGAVAARDGGGGWCGGIVDEDGVAVEAEDHDQVAGGGGYGSARELTSGVADRGDDGNAARTAPAHCAPVRKPEQLTRDSMRGGGTHRGGPDAVDVERGMQDLRGERDGRRRAAPVAE